MRVIRRVWPETFASCGYGLANACAVLGISLVDHHRAGADAVATARVLTHALEFTGWTVDEAISRCMLKMSNSRFYVGPPDKDGPLSGHVVVFTGELSILRTEAAAIARALGAEVGAGVTRRTTLLVVGNDGQKTGKHRKAEQLVARGAASIRSISESGFVEMSKLEGGSKNDHGRD